jgi:hypothetical protein
VLDDGSEGSAPAPGHRERYDAPAPLPMEYASAATQRQHRMEQKPALATLKFVGGMLGPVLVAIGAFALDRRAGWRGDGLVCMGMAFLVMVPIVLMPGSTRLIAMGWLLTLFMGGLVALYVCGMRWLS